MEKLRNDFVEKNEKNEERKRRFEWEKEQRILAKQEDNQEKQIQIKRALKFREKSLEKYRQE